MPENNVPPGIEVLPLWLDERLSWNSVIAEEIRVDFELFKLQPPREGENLIDWTYQRERKKIPGFSILHSE